jgi:hypothetical protein
MTTATIPPPLPTSTPSAAPSTTLPPALWPIPIPVLGVTGEVNSGKSRFLRAIAPGARTVIFDTEKGHVGCSTLGYRHVDVAQETVGRSALDTFLWFWDTVKSIPSGRFDCIALDVAEDIENGLADWVWESPLHFKHTRDQYLRMSGIYWGDMTNLWKQILLDISARCQTFAFAVHTGAVWVDKKPTLQRRPKGKRTLDELATLYLHLDRPTEPDGSRRSMPTARVRKTRLAVESIVDGRLVTVEVLPPQLPEATPEAIREYMVKPPNWRRLKAEEKAPEPRMSDDARLELRAQIASSEAEAERLRLERLAQEAKGGGGITLGTGTQPQPLQPQPAGTPATVGPVAELPGTRPTGDATPPPLANLPGATLQESLAAPTPNGEAPESRQPPTGIAPDATYPDGRLRVLGPSLTGSIHRLWDELMMLTGLPMDQHGAAHAGLLAKVGAPSPQAATVAQQRAMEDLLVAKIRGIHASRGTVCPF